MADIKKLAFRHDEREYSLVLGWNDEAFFQHGSVSFTIVGSVSIDEEDAQEVDLAVTFERDDDGALWAVVSHGDEKVFSAPVSELVGIAPEALAVEIINAIPVQFVDPLLGCALRAGLASVLEQTISCYTEAEGAEGFLAVAKAVLNCLGENVLGIGRRAAFRFVRCFVFA